MIITIDANILVAFFDDQDFDKGFVKFCHTNNVQQVLIPSPAVSEFLSKDNADRFQFIQTKKRIASIVNFDEKAAYLTANIAEKYYKDKLEIPKPKVKVDLQILGTALANGSSFILTRDNDFKSYINHLKLPITLLTMADLQINEDLFGPK